MSYLADDTRYDAIGYRALGASGLKVPPLSLGFWHNFGSSNSFDTQRAIVRRAFDRGITHMDLANNYGPPAGSGEANFGRILTRDLNRYRDELIISTKAGYEMWPGPYGDGGSRKYLTASLDQSLIRMGLDYVDIFYSHRFDETTPLEETMGALATAVTSGKALYVGISSYSPEQTIQAQRILEELGVPLTVSQPAYSMLERSPEKSGLLDTLLTQQVGCIVFSPLAQGLLTDRYLNGIPADSRAATSESLNGGRITPSYLAQIRELGAIAERRGQTIAQLALAWVLRRPEVNSAIIGASSVEQLDQNLGALENRELNVDECAEIDRILGGTRTA
jgi:L-glyceraldehyde 3-phosphate reductase